MTINRIFELMRIATENKTECYNKAFAARTNAESVLCSLEADKWSSELVRLSRKAGKLADKK